MKSVLFISTVIVFIIGILGCQQQSSKINSSNSEKVVNVTIVRFDQQAELNVSDEVRKVNTILHAIKQAKKHPGIVNVEKPEYKIKIDNETYFLWVDENSVSIMNLNDNHSLYTLTESSAKELKEVIEEISSV
ncbi:MAG TPA: hypothetical protein VKZ77_09955 [Bacillaceae bacterium]|nr:hypothetical protein [Paenibacillus bovis]HLU22788.1 hypothetical protein [Bacillaceae bacterium]